MKYIRKDAFINATQWTGKNFNELRDLAKNNIAHYEHCGLLLFDGAAWNPIEIGSFIYLDKMTGHCSATPECEFIARYEVAE